MLKARMANQFNPSHINNTINRDQMQPVYQRQTMSQRAIYVSGPIEWNRLPEDIRKTQTSGRFIKLLKTHLLSLYRNLITKLYIRPVVVFRTILILFFPVQFRYLNLLFMYQ